VPPAWDQRDDVLSFFRSFKLKARFGGLEASDAKCRADPASACSRSRTR
jgi:hypothetical protein